MKVTVIGGGNIGTQFACTFASKGHDVTLYCSKAAEFGHELTVVDGERHVIYSGIIQKATNDIEEAMDAEIIFVTYPAFALGELADKMAPYAGPSVNIGVIPGTGGAEFAFRECIKKGAGFFGIQRVPSVARIVEYGKCVCAEGYRDKLHLAAIPGSKSPELAAFMSSAFDMPCEILDNYFCVTMTPSNPILHTSRLATLFEDYYEGKVYDRNPLFYGEWSNASSERLLACDAEHQMILKKLKKLNLSSVRSLVEHYDNSDTIEKMTAKISSIKSLHNLASPMIKVENGWIPNFKSRYCVADFPYGLAIISDLAKIANVKVPNIEKTLDWYKRVTGDNNYFRFENYDITTIDDIYDLYSEDDNLNRR